MPKKYFEDENLFLSVGSMDEIAQQNYSKTPNVPDNYVHDLQNDLIKLGFSVGHSAADGWFGDKTKIAVREFQQESLTDKRTVNDVMQIVNVTFKGTVNGIVKPIDAKEIHLWILNEYKRYSQFIKPPSGLVEIKRVFGDPVFTLGSQDPYCPYVVPREWNIAHLASFDLAHPRIRRIYCHRLIGPIVQKVFYEIKSAGLASEISTCGCLCRRKKVASSTQMSVHSWGIALDVNQATNQYDSNGDMHPQVVEIFTRNGFEWGGTWRTKDPMHFQYCNDY